MKDFTIFWGCTIQARFPFLEKSTRLVLEGFKLPYRDIDGFTCCPEKSLVNNVDHATFVVTAARNVAVADAEGVDVVSPCTGCISNLATVSSELKTHPKEKDAVNGLLKEVGREFKGESMLAHLVPFFHDKVGILKVKQAIKRDFKGMKIALHYGCHMMRPAHALKNDDPLDPKKFDNLIRALGAESMQYPSKLTCCGQGLDRVDMHDLALNMARVKLRELKNMGADAMVLCCPSCYLQFDNNQFLMMREGEKLGLPIIYFTELLGLAMGYSPEELGLDAHRVDVTPFLEKWDRMAEEHDKRSGISKGLNVLGALE